MLIKIKKKKKKKAIQQGDTERAKIYASNAIRKKNEGLNFLRLASRIDAVASRVQTTVTIRTVSKSMGNLVKGMDKAMKSMNLEQVIIKYYFIIIINILFIYSFMFKYINIYKLFYIILYYCFSIY